MIRSAVTVSLVKEAVGGPFVFWDGIADACRHAARLGFDAIEVFAPDANAVDRPELRELLEKHSLSVAAVGTGAGMVKHGLSLTNPDSDHRIRAIQFVRNMIDFGAEFSAPAIIGSMQGRAATGVDRDIAIGLLSESLDELAAYAGDRGVNLLIEPLNRYETNLLRTIAEGVELLQQLRATNVRLLADLFHMNIEEVNLADALRHGASHIGHIHFVDSNRRAAGMGHLDYAPIVLALREINYSGYLSAEAFPLPDSLAAAESTIQSLQRLGLA